MTAMAERYVNQAREREFARIVRDACHNAASREMSIPFPSTGSKRSQAKSLQEPRRTQSVSRTRIRSTGSAYANCFA